MRTAEARIVHYGLTGPSLAKRGVVMEKKKRRNHPKNYVMTRDEIAEELGIAPGAVKALLKSAAEKIKIRHPELRDWL